MVVVCWECTAGAQVFHLLDPLAEQAWSASDPWASLLGHKNSAPSLFVDTESDPREHGLSHLKPEVDIGELILESEALAVGNSRVPLGGQLTPKVGHSNSHSMCSFLGDILIP
jgi:hypothetical protein